MKIPKLLYNLPPRVLPGQLELIFEPVEVKFSMGSWIDAGVMDIYPDIWTKEVGAPKASFPTLEKDGFIMEAIFSNEPADKIGTVKIKPLKFSKVHISKEQNNYLIGQKQLKVRTKKKKYEKVI